MPTAFDDLIPATRNQFEDLIPKTAFDDLIPQEPPQYRSTDSPARPITAHAARVALEASGGSKPEPVPSIAKETLRPFVEAATAPLIKIPRVLDPNTFLGGVEDAAKGLVEGATAPAGAAAILGGVTGGAKVAAPVAAYFSGKATEQAASDIGEASVTKTPGTIGRGLTTLTAAIAPVVLPLAASEVARRQERPAAVEKLPGPQEEPPVVPTETPNTLDALARSLPRGGDIRERFKPIERQDSPTVARYFVDTVQAGTQARTIVRDFMNRAFEGGDADALVQDFVALGRDNRRLELQARGIPASQVPALPPAEAARIRADPHIQKAIEIWNSEIAPAIEDIRTRNGMLMSPNWNSMDLMLNLPAEYNPVNQGNSGVNLKSVFDQPAIGEGSYQTDPIETLNQIVRGHLRYDAASKLADAIRHDASIPIASVQPITVRGLTFDPATFPKSPRGEYFVAPYKGKLEKVEAVNLNPNERGTPEYHYVPKRVADQFNKIRQERGHYDSWGDKVLSAVIQFGILPGTFAPHVVRELSAVSARIAQSGQHPASMLPSWLGSTPLAIRRIGQMRDTLYGQLMQRLLDQSGADRGVGYGIKEAQSTLGKILKLPHEALFNHDWGVDVLARRAIADAHLRMQLGNGALDGIETSLNSGAIKLPEAMTQIQARLGDADVLALGRRVNNTMGYGNPQTRTAFLNWVQRILPFVSSESGKIPDEVRRFTTMNVDVPALKKSVGRGDYGQAVKQVGGMLATGAAGVYIAQNVLNQLISGHPMWDNPEGRKTDVQLSPDFYWSNLDPGLARAARITGAKEAANTGTTPDVPRELVNEAFSIIHPGLRLAFSALTDKELFLKNNHQLMPASTSDLVPFGTARNVIRAATSGKPVDQAVVRDVAGLGGVQLSGPATDPKRLKGAKLNDYIETLYSKARQLPRGERRAFVLDRLSKDDVTGKDKSRARDTLERRGLYRHE